jgi:hypothetical protein
VGVDADGEGPEVLDPEFPEALGHQIFPGDLFDLLDLGCFEGRGAADDRQVHHPELLHRGDRLVGEATFAADCPHAVPTAERFGEADHPCRGCRADADLLVASSALHVLGDLAHVRCGVEQEGAFQVHRRLDLLVEDADLGAVADPDDLALHGHLVACLQLQDLVRVGDREADLVARHRFRTPGRSRSHRSVRCERRRDGRPSTGS